MNRPLASLLLGLLGLPFAHVSSDAQLVLPGAAPAATTEAPKPKSVHKAAAATKAATSVASKPAAAGLASVVGRPLMLNGKSGLLQISGDDKSLTVDKLELAGEGVSDSTQRCVVDIVGAQPIEATPTGRPDGLERFEVPAGPIAFDVLDGAVLVPTQITACVFKAADCQTSPGGLWGPDGASLVGDAARIIKERAEAEKAMAKLVRAIEDRVEESPRAAELIRDQNAFAGLRDDLCRDYAKESVHGYCALRVTEARTALLQLRLDELGVEASSTAAGEKSKKTKPKKSAKQP
jgi:hypothetical protein